MKHTALPQISWYAVVRQHTERGDIHSKTDRCVVRNQAYRRSEFSICERQNERKMKAITMGILSPNAHRTISSSRLVRKPMSNSFRMVEDGAITIRGLTKQTVVQQRIARRIIFQYNRSALLVHQPRDLREILICLGNRNEIFRYLYS